MSKRLQVILKDAEYRELQRTARQQGMTVSQWVRDAIRSAKAREPARGTVRKRGAVREASRHSYQRGDISAMPASSRAGNIGGMLADIERGFAQVARLALLARHEPPSHGVSHMLDDVHRIRSLSPEDRIREVAAVNRFVSAARRVAPDRAVRS